MKRFAPLIAVAAASACTDVAQGLEVRAWHNNDPSAP
jgi:hypothetical protein